MSDHISGPRALAEPIADITDVYAFPSPERPGHLVLVMNTLPFAQPSDAVLGRARLPLPAAPAHGRRGERSGAVRRRRATSSCSTACSPIPPTGDGARGQEGVVHDAGGRDGLVPGERRAGRLRARRARLRRPALGSVHHGRPGGAEDDRDRQARVHRSGLDLPRRQERPQPRRRDRLRAVPGRRGAGRRRRGDADARQVQRADRARRAARGEEPDARRRSSSIRSTATSRSATSTTWRTRSTSPTATRARTGRG